MNKEEEWRKWRKMKRIKWRKGKRREGKWRKAKESEEKLRKVKRREGKWRKAKESKKSEWKWRGVTENDKKWRMTEKGVYFQNWENEKLKRNNLIVLIIWSSTILSLPLFLALPFSLPLSNVISNCPSLFHYIILLITNFHKPIQGLLKIHYDIKDTLCPCQNVREETEILPFKIRCVWCSHYSLILFWSVPITQKLR